MKERKKQTRYHGITVSHALEPKVYLTITTATALSLAIQITITSTRVLVIDVINKQHSLIYK